MLKNGPNTPNSDTIPQRVTPDTKMSDNPNLTIDYCSNVTIFPRMSDKSKVTKVNCSNVNTE